MYFDAVGQSINWGISMEDFIDKLYVSEPSNDVYHYPNNIVIPVDMNLTVHSSVVETTMAPIASLAVNVTVLGKDPAAMTHTPFCFEATKYMLWGYYTNMPDSLTTEGKNLLENTIWSCMGGYPVSEFNGTVFLPLGVIGIFAITLIVTCRRIKV
jgi:hypothetical protein